MPWPLVSVSVERVTEPAEDRLLGRPHADRSAAPRRAARRARAAAPPAARRAGSGVSTLIVTIRSPRPPRRPGTPWPRMTVSLPDWVPGGTSSSKPVWSPDSSAPSALTRSASRVGRLSVVPSAAAVIGMTTVAVQVVAVPGEGRVRRDVDLDVEVTRGAAAGADLALLAQLHAGAGVDAGRDLDGEGAARAHPSVARTLPARVGDHGAEAATRRARPQGADLAEEGTLHVGDLALSVAGLALDRLAARRSAVAAAGRAADRRVDLELARHPERRFGEVDLEPDQRVLAAPGPRARARGSPPGPEPPKNASMMSVNEKPAPWPPKPPANGSPPRS